MLIIISDLHFVDGTAGEHNVPSRAVEYFFNDVAAIANKETSNIKEIKIVLLGDIFDLLRTEKWFDYPVDERPWGNNEIAIEQHAQEILGYIIGHNENLQSFQKLRDGLEGLKQKCPKLEYEPRLIYLPGNHDRLINQYSSLREMVCNCLGIPRNQHNPADPFLNSYEDVRYGVFGRHGHEFDKYNYEGGTSFTPQDYRRVPIGDPITTELIAKLPHELTKRIKPLPWLSQIEKQNIRRNFQEIENVRPMSATIEWLLYQVRQVGWLKEVIEDTVDEVIKLFDALDFVKLWYERHDKWTDWLDEADKIQAFLFILRNFKLYRTEKLWHLAAKAKDYFVKDDLLEAAPQEFSHLDPHIRYIVYGHTHEPLAVAIRTAGNATSPLEQVYLNTGTWRSRHFKATQDDSFITWKNMTYVIFYYAGERDASSPVFETWTGTLKAS